jgi:hypothetical protein
MFSESLICGLVRRPTFYTTRQYYISEAVYVSVHREGAGHIYSVRTLRKV